MIDDRSVTPKAYRIENGEVTSEVVKEGETIIDFRGDKWVFASVLPDGKSYKIYARKPNDTRSYRTFFPSVFRLEVK